GLDGLFAAHPRAGPVAGSTRKRCISVVCAYRRAGRRICKLKQDLERVLFQKRQIGRNSPGTVAPVRADTAKKHRCVREEPYPSRFPIEILLRNEGHGRMIGWPESFRPETNLLFA